MEGFIITGIQAVLALALGALSPAMPAEEPEEYYEEAYGGYYEPYYSGYDHEFISEGVIEQDGVEYTWYSQRILPGGGLDELNDNGRYVDDEGFVRDGNGYIAVASSDYEVGTVVDTPFGEGKVYDGGCDSGVIDVYTDW